MNSPANSTTISLILVGLIYGSKLGQTWLKRMEFGVLIIHLTNASSNAKPHSGTIINQSPVSLVLRLHFWVSPSKAPKLEALSTTPTPPRKKKNIATFQSSDSLGCVLLANFVTWNLQLSRPKKIQTRGRSAASMGWILNKSSSDPIFVTNPWPENGGRWVWHTVDTLQLRCLFEVKVLWRTYPQGYLFS